MLSWRVLAVFTVIGLLTAGELPGGTLRQIAVDPHASGWSGLPSVALAAPGRAVVVWAADWTTQVEDVGVYGRLFSTTGRPLGSRFRISEGGAEHIQPPDVASTGDGGYVVVWRERSVDNDWTTRLRQFDRHGTARGAAVRVPTNPDSTRWTVKVATADDSGDVFVAAHQWYTSIVRVFHFDATGTPVGASFDLNIQSNGNRVALEAIEVGPASRPVVVWTTTPVFTPRDFAGYRVEAASMTADGTPIDRLGIGPPMAWCVPRSPSAAAGPEGVTVVWHDDGFCDIRVLSLGFDRDGHAIGDQPSVLAHHRVEADLTLGNAGEPVLTYLFRNQVQGMGAGGDDGLVTIAEGVSPRRPRIAGDAQHGYLVVWNDTLEGSRPGIIAAAYGSPTVHAGASRVAPP